jgi:hypothetical protein
VFGFACFVCEGEGGAMRTRGGRGGGRRGRDGGGRLGGKRRRGAAAGVRVRGCVCERRRAVALDYGLWGRWFCVRVFVCLCARVCVGGRGEGGGRCGGRRERLSFRLFMRAVLSVCASVRRDRGKCASTPSLSPAPAPVPKPGPFTRGCTPSSPSRPRHCMPAAPTRGCTPSSTYGLASRSSSPARMTTVVVPSPTCGVSRFRAARASA